MKKRLILIFFLFLAPIFAWALDDPFDVGYTITSPFGPRIKPETTNWRIHAGVDYDPDTHGGTTIYAVEKGTIASISDQGANGIVVAILSETNTWYYCHTFTSFVDNTTGYFTLRKTGRQPMNWEAPTIFPLPGSFEPVSAV
ncbi:MAG TPA: hypothetical protein PK876_04285 [Elusimicrobiota bacterium]|nr:hypothetical protein [Elusimicrobiota bacterium]